MKIKLCISVSESYVPHVGDGDVVASPVSISVSESDAL